MVATTKAVVASAPFGNAITSYGLRYSPNVHSSSSLKMTARLSQTSNELGARLTVRVGLKEFGLPVSGRADVRAVLTRPDGSETLRSLVEIEPGIGGVGRRYGGPAGSIVVAQQS